MVMNIDLDNAVFKIDENEYKRLIENSQKYPNPIIQNGKDFDLEVRVLSDDHDDWEIPRDVTQSEKNRVLLRREFIKEVHKQESEIRHRCYSENRQDQINVFLKSLVRKMLFSKKYEILKNDSLVGLHCWRF